MCAPNELLQRFWDAELFGLQQTRATHVDRAPVDSPLHAAPGERFEAADRGEFEIPFRCRPDDRPGEHVLGVLLNRCRERKRLVFFYAVYRVHGHDTMLAFRQRAGLIEHNHVQVTSRFQRQPVPNEQAAPCRKRSGDCDDQRNGKPEGVRACDYEDCNRPLQAEGYGARGE